MKAIDLSNTSPTLAEVLTFAGEDNVILRTPEGRQYLLAEIDDFKEEIARTTQNESLMQMLNDRSRETTHVPLGQVREQLKGKKTTQTTRQRK